MVTFKNVSKSFGDIKAVSDVSFEVKKGEFAFLTGPSGSGKTTLLKLILREYLPDSGEILLDEINVTTLKNKQVPILRQKIGTVFQDLKVLPERTVKENIEVALAVVGLSEGEWKSRLDDILKWVNLEKRAQLFPAQLSGGELQRVSIARALVVNPQLILADEPTGNLDWETSLGIMDLLLKINKEGKTVIIATHNQMIIDKYNKKIIHLVNGKLVKEKGEDKKVKTRVLEEV
ncbi:MAG: ATP-binding cassette domain-containing protein [Candidatus Microgenomates bacterium]